MVVIMTEKVSVRPLANDDRMGWEALWQGYQNHLRSKLPDNVVAETWLKLMDTQVPIFGIAAFIDTYRMAGIVHYSFSPSSWSKGPMCQIQDLFVGHELRGQGVGHALIDGAFSAADKEKCSQVFWHLHRSDFRAKLLLDNYNAGPEGQIVQVRRKLSR